MNNSNHGIMTIYGPKGIMSVDLDKMLAETMGEVPLQEIEYLCIASSPNV
jgi:hypothetical protein